MTSEPTREGDAARGRLHECVVRLAQEDELSLLSEIAEALALAADELAVLLDPDTITGSYAYTSARQQGRKILVELHRSAESVLG